MHAKINFHQFHEAFRSMGRRDNFSHEGLTILFNYLEQYEEDTGQSVELDVIAFCCDYNEDSFLDVAKNYDIDISECEDDDEIRETVLAYLEHETWVCGHTGDIVVYACF